MNFITGADVGVDGTHLLDTIRTTFNEIEGVFGPPTFGPDGDGDKVTCEWCILFDDYQVATIYDWKVLGGTPRDEYTWHIGGHSHEVVGRIEKMLKGLV